MEKEIEKEIEKKIKGTLVWTDWNAFAIMWLFKRLASKQWWTNEEIKKVLDRAREGDYSHLVQTIDSYFKD